MASLATPNVLNYYVGKGIMYWTPAGGSEVDLGNAPRFEFDPKNTRLPHYSSRLGVKFKDFEIIQAKEPEFTLMLDEWTQDNLALALMSSLSGGTVNIMDLPGLTGQLRFVGANAVGPKKQIILPSVLIAPTGKLGFIEDGWGQIEITGPVFGDVTTGSFGTIVDL